MKSIIQRNSLNWLWLTALVILLDQLTKYWVQKTLILYQSEPLTSFFNLTLKYNTGAAFSLLGQHPHLALWLFSGIATLISLILFLILYRLPRNNPWFACAIALVLGGALGNLIDRLWHGHVIDFLDFYWKTAHFATFNVADSAVTVGAILWFLSMIFTKK